MCAKHPSVIYIQLANCCYHRQLQKQPYSDKSETVNLKGWRVNFLLFLYKIFLFAIKNQNLFFNFLTFSYSNRSLDKDHMSISLSSNIKINKIFVNPFEPEKEFKVYIQFMWILTNYIQYITLIQYDPWGRSFYR